MLEWYDYMRLASALLAVIGMYRLGRMFLHRRRQEAAGLKFDESRIGDFFWVISASLLTIVIGSLEQTIGDAPYRSAAILTFMITLVALRATRRRDDALNF